METFDEAKNLARISAGMKGGPMFKNPLTPQKMTFVEGNEPEVLQKLKHTGIVQSTPTDTWNSRR